ncbi:hypothetical protein CAOG_04208 [Capsaspora owczarzaki ATCC 30864]|uniref:TMC domain-containing protein n=1 Tax=Capsaspora owczarzaki (strain ATCC 30864) TaxID=595528 RepID=A0A0D2X2Z4_CAPO3|nr:hypothetical protein CAOG_04208 [Capsaspora owczarzaki ATCC 30864]KJE93414.1 hypothetical protein CAOG_004208 [Capsaspora owczarzaki ATCC 30864]|eukprot:XP_004348033.1 hypothetical protein CAOG_04208 [Capsaspora owczarzaki ATCC 30864]
MSYRDSFADVPLEQMSARRSNAMSPEDMFFQEQLLAEASRPSSLLIPPSVSSYGGGGEIGTVSVRSSSPVITPQRSRSNSAYNNAPVVDLHAPTANPRGNFSNLGVVVTPLERKRQSRAIENMELASLGYHAEAHQEPQPALQPADHSGAGVPAAEAAPAARKGKTKAVASAAPPPEENLDAPSRKLLRSLSSNHLDATTQVEAREILDMLPSELRFHTRQLEEQLQSAEGFHSPLVQSYSIGDTATILSQQAEVRRLKHRPTLKNVKRTRSTEMYSEHEVAERTQSLKMEIGATKTKNLQKERENLGHSMTKWIRYLKHRYQRKKVLQKDPVPIFRHSIKVIEGRLGTAVASFFVFTRWLFLLNIGLSIIWLSLTTFPQLSQTTGNSSVDFNALNLLTGGGYLATTPMFYAGYDNSVPHYSMDLSYVIAIGVTYLISFFAILYSLGAKFSRDRDPTTLVARDSTYPFAVAVLGSWDYSIRDDNGAVTMHLGIAHTLKEIYSRQETAQAVLTTKETAKRFVRRLISMTVSLLILALCAYLVYVLIDLQASHAFDDGAIQLVAPASISAMNILVPWIFTKMLEVEKWSSQDVELRVTVYRSFFVRLAAVIAVIVSIWQTRQSNLATQCWQNRIGQEMYRMLVIDLIVSSIFTIVQQFGWRYMKDKILHRGNKVDFDMSKNVLDMTYRQTLIWLGCLFCPVLPAIGSISIIITFYIRKFVYLRVSKQPRRFFSAARSNSFFLLTLLMTLILVFIPVGYILVDGQPSCGPHKNLDSIYSIVPYWLRRGPSWILAITNYLFTVAFLVPFSLLLISALYYMHASKKGIKERLKETTLQLDMEREDKRYLLKQYRIN